MTAEPLPTEPGEAEPYAEAARFVRAHRREHLRLVASNGESLELPDPLAEVLDSAADALASGATVSVLPTETLLTTTQAAEVLGVSRPTLVRLLELGEISYARPGTHRRLKLSDVLAYRDERRQRSEELHHALAEEAIAVGVYDWTAEDYAAADEQLRTARKKLAREYEHESSGQER